MRCIVQLEYRGVDMIMLVLSHSAVESFYVQASEIPYVRQYVQKKYTKFISAQGSVRNIPIVKIIKIPLK